MGEFGWELFAWQAALRRAALEDYEEAYVLCQPGKEVLYEDFAKVNVIPDALAADMLNDRATKVCPGNKCLAPYNRHWSRERLHSGGFFNQRFVKLGRYTEDLGRDVIVHARGRAFRQEDNWPLKNYEAIVGDFVKSGLSVGIVGLTAHTLPVTVKEGITDLRDRPLREVCDIIASSRLTVGTGSGPIHLASLCGCAHVVFTPAYNIPRYADHWNPFKTPVSFLAGGTNPTVVDVLETCYKELGR